jgi:arginyl-tRNA synthetase
MSDVQTTLQDAFRAAIGAAFGPDFADADPQVRPSANPEFGDYQANAAMGLAKRLRKAPREVAQAIVSRLDLSGVAEKPGIAGPGFINIRLSPSFLNRAVSDVAAAPRLGASAAEKPETVVVDYSCPNVAKEMHVGHLRSTIIGDAVARVLVFLGHRVIRQNHLGDWGTQFGMLIEHIADLGWKADGAYSIGDLNELYRTAKVKFDADAGFADRARRRVVALQSGDGPTVQLWKLLIEESKKHFDAVYAKLGVLLDDGDYRGESFYNPMLAPTVEELLGSGIAVISEGAACVFPPGFTGQDGGPTPLIVRKSDGGFGYDATDLAAVRYRIRDLHATRLVYVTDSRQSRHFAMVFKGAEMAGWLIPPARAEHVPFGTILGEDGKPFKTRSGETVRLSDLLEEAERRAFDIVTAKSPDAPEAERRAVARAVGIGAIKYADLSNDRIKDYVFDWERMLSFDGNTAPYLQNAYVRIRSIFRKAAAVAAPEAAAQGLTPGNVDCRTAEERSLALALLEFGATVESVARSLEPHRLCVYLYGLASQFHSFYEKCPVLAAEDAAVRASRLALCGHVAATIAKGLELLGIAVVEKM